MLNSVSGWGGGESQEQLPARSCSKSRSRQEEAMHHLHMLWFHLESHISFPTIKLWNSGNSSFTFLFFWSILQMLRWPPSDSLVWGGL